jgi:hypothetical protein
VLSSPVDTVRVIFAREYPRVQVLEEQVLERGGGYSVNIQLVQGAIEGSIEGAIEGQLGVVVEVVVEEDEPLHFLRVGADRSTLATNGSTRSDGLAGDVIASPRGELLSLSQYIPGDVFGFFLTPFMSPFETPSM